MGLSHHPAKPIPEAVSIKHTAEILDISEVTVRRWIRLRIIKAYRIGPQLIRIPRSEIARMRSVRVAARDYFAPQKFPRV